MILRFRIFLKCEFSNRSENAPSVYAHASSTPFPFPPEAAVSTAAILSDDDGGSSVDSCCTAGRDRRSRDRHRCQPDIVTRHARTEPEVTSEWRRALFVAQLGCNESDRCSSNHTVTQKKRSNFLLCASLLILDRNWWFFSYIWSTSYKLQFRACSSGMRQEFRVIMKLKL